MSTEVFAEFRSHVPATEKWAYFETAGTGLIPDFVYDAVKRYQDDRYLQGGDSVWTYENGDRLDTLTMIERSKQAIAQMICCQKEDIAFGHNSSQLYTLLTSGLKFAPGDNIILPKDGWMSNRFAWQIRQQDDLEIRFAEPQNGILTAGDFIKLCDKRTKAICITYVESATGFCMDVDPLGDFCRHNGIWLACDGVQALGVLPIDVIRCKIDFLVGNDYKWMMNYSGTGYAYISPALRNDLKQFGAGWMSDKDRFNTEKEFLQLREDAGRFELGFPTASGVYGLGLVAEKYNLSGRYEIRDYVLGLVEYLKDAINAMDGVDLLYDFPQKNQSAIVDIMLADKLEITNQQLADAGIFAHIRPLAGRGGRFIRLSVHYYNNKEDVDRLCRVISGKE